MRWVAAVLALVMSAILPGCVTERVIEPGATVTVTEPGPTMTVTETVHPEEPPVMGWNESETEDSFSVSQAPRSVDWRDFKIKASVVISGLKFSLNGDAPRSLGTSYTDIVSTPTEVQAGDEIVFCAAGTGGDVRITIRHPASDSVSQEYKFATIAPC